MKKLLTVALTLLLVGCASVPPAENVSYPVQTDENVQNSVQTPESESETVDAPIVEEAVEEDVSINDDYVSDNESEPVESQKRTESGTDLPDTQDSAENDDLVDAPNVEESARTHENRWIKKCREFGYNSSNLWADVYEVIVDDVCSVSSVNNNVVHLVYGPSVDRTNPSVQKYVDTVLFAHTYWSRYIGFSNKPVWVIAGTSDKDWWKSEHSKYVTQMHEFTCPYFNENYFCSKKYYPEAGNVIGNAEVHLLIYDQSGALNADAYIDPAHNAVHWYQQLYGYEHWHEFLIEGHATLYEIAFHVLENSKQGVRAAERQRESFAWLSHTRDSIKFTATNGQEVMAHIESCYGRGYDCNHYYYGGGAMLHEKIILDFGYASYLSWHVKIDAVTNMSQYYGLFSAHYGQTLEQYIESNYAPYTAESFNYYYDIW